MKTTNTADTVITNINMLLDLLNWSVEDLSKKSKVPKRTIYAYLKKERKPSVEITDEIAQGFGLHGWHLLLPNLIYDIAKNGHLEEVINQYTDSTVETRVYIDSILKRERGQ